MKHFERWFKKNKPYETYSCMDMAEKSYREALERVLEERKVQGDNHLKCVFDWIEQELGNPKTIVVNRHYKSFTKYIGRGTKFGNDYRIGPDGTREDVIAKHKKDFYDNPELQEAVWNELRGETLGCFCKPLACHGDTYVEYIEEREKNETG